jgi:hypothetical protein
MKLWAGRFQKETNTLVNDFNASINFDARLYKQDIVGSIAHATMLGEQGIISSEDAQAIIEGLQQILSEILIHEDGHQTRKHFKMHIAVIRGSDHKQQIGRFIVKRFIIDAFGNGHGRKRRCLDCLTLCVRDCDALADSG